MFKVSLRLTTNFQEIGSVHPRWRVILGFHRAFLKVNHFYWPTNALNCIKLKG